HWSLNPAFQFSDELNAVEQWLTNPSAQAARIDSEPVVSAHEEARFRNQQVTCVGSNLPLIGDFLDRLGRKAQTPAEDAERKRTIFSLFYMHHLVGDHPRVGALKEAMDLVRSFGGTIVAYVTPV